MILQNINDHVFYALRREVYAAHNSQCLLVLNLHTSDLPAEVSLILDYCLNQIDLLLTR